MRSDRKNRPTRAVSGLIAIAMSMTIVSQVLTLLSSERESGWGSAAILILSTLLLAYAVYQLVRTGPMRSTYDQSLDLTAGYDQTHEAIRQVITDDTEARPKNVTDTTFTASVPISFSSWGEKLTIALSPLNGGTHVSVRSTCLFPLQIVDWGKNRRNVTRLLASIESRLPTMVPTFDRNS